MHSADVTIIFVSQRSRNAKKNKINCNKTNITELITVCLKRFFNSQYSKI